LISFSVRPKLAKLIFHNEECNVQSLKEIIKVVICLNRLLVEGENLLLGTQKTAQKKASQIVINRQEQFSSSSSWDNLGVNKPILATMENGGDPFKRL